MLLDDNYATIVAAVEEGRRIYDNIRKFIRYTMTSNAGEIWVMLLAPFLGMPLPSPAAADPVGQPGHRWLARPGAHRRAGRARYHAAPAPPA